jgi:hypothetical protein
MFAFEDRPQLESHVQADSRGNMAAANVKNQYGTLQLVRNMHVPHLNHESVPMST